MEGQRPLLSRKKSSGKALPCKILRGEKGRKFVRVETGKLEESEGKGPNLKCGLGKDINCGKKKNEKRSILLERRLPEKKGGGDILRSIFAKLQNRPKEEEIPGRERNQKIGEKAVSH